MANKDSDDDDRDRDSDELELGRIDPLAGEYSEMDDAILAAKILGEPPPPPREIGGGRWVLLAQIGSGGMGKVYAAYDQKLERKVAIKFLLLGQEQDAEAARARLVREGPAMARVSKHPNVVQVFDVGAEAERMYLVMEYIKGPTLAEWQRERTCDEILAAYRQAGQGLAAIHAAELIHRDFKPANVFVTTDQAGHAHAAVGDLGLAIATASEADRPDSVTTESALHPAAALTATGMLLGTPAYMAPEQLRGRRADARSDQFAFCVSLYEALCGQRPFQAPRSEPAALLQAMERGMPAARQKNGKPLPAHVERVLRRGLSMNPEARFPDMRTLLAELAPRPRRAWPWVTAGAVASGLVIAILLLRQNAPDPCIRQAKAELAGFWDPPAVEARLARQRNEVGATTLTGAWETLGKTLKMQSEAWYQARKQECSKAIADVPPARLAARQECLGTNQRALTEVSRVWFAKESAIGAHPEVGLFNAAADLLGLRDCTLENLTMASAPGVVASSETGPGPGALDALGDKLVRIQVLDHQAKYEDARKLALATADEVNQLGNSPVRAEVQYRLGHLLTYLGEHREADGLLQEAAELAARYDMKPLAVDIWLYRLKHALVELDDTDRARRWLEVTRYTLLQTGDVDARNLRHAEYEEALGLLASREGDREAARTHHQNALQMRENAPELRTVLPGEASAGFIDFLRSKSLNNLANAVQAAKRYKEAVPLYEEALAVRQRFFGPDHPEVGQVLFNLGLVEKERGNYARAIEHLAGALAIARNTPAVRTDMLLRRLRGIGSAEYFAYHDERARGNQERAREHLDLAARHAGEIETLHRQLEQEQSPAMQDRARVEEHVLLAGVHWERKELPAALDQLEQTLRMRERDDDARACGDRQDAYRDDLVSAASLLCELGRTAEARAYVEKALNPPVACPSEPPDGIPGRIQEEITQPACRP